MKQPHILHYTVRGSGPTVVLLHGFLSSGEYWEPVAELSIGKHTVVTIDLLGFGKSPKPRRSRYDYEAHLASIEATLEHLSIKEPFTLVGHSMGSLLALRYATLHEHRVKKLLLVNMPVMMGKKEVKSEILKTSFLYNIGLRSWTHRVTWAVFRTLHKLRALPPTMRQRLRENAYFLQHNAESRIRSFQRVIAAARADADLATVNVMTYVVSGLNDRAVYLENLARTASMNPHVALETVDTGHHIPCVWPERVTRHF